MNKKYTRAKTGEVVSYISTYLDDETLKEFRIAGAELGFKGSELLRHILHEWLKTFKEGRK